MDAESLDNQDHLYLGSTVSPQLQRDNPPRLTQVATGPVVRSRSLLSPLEFSIGSRVQRFRARPHRAPRCWLGRHSFELRRSK